MSGIESPRLGVSPEYLERLPGPYVFSSKRWVRLVLVIGAVPIAIVANGFRIMGTGLVGEYWGRDMSEGFFHGFSGVVVFVFSFLLLISLGQAVRWTLGVFRRRATA